MKTTARALAPALLAAACLFSLGAPASAESRDADTFALGWQTENADAVVVGVPVQDRRPREGGPFVMELRVEESIRGPAAASSVLVVVVENHGEARPYALGARHLVFLRALPRPEGAPERWALLTGASSARPVPEKGPESLFPGIARDVAATLGEGGAVKDPGALRVHLVRWIEDADPGIALSAALDLVRHEELLPALTAAERGRIVAAFRAEPVGKSTKGALALAAAATRDPAAGAVLVESLLDPRARLVRGDVGEALRRLADPAVPSLILKRMDGADDGRRADLLQVLGTLGAPEGAEAARAALASPSAEVRLEAAHALGLIARAVRRKDPDARVAGRDDLAKAAAPGEGNDARAALWALAQLDDPEAFAILRKVAAEGAREEFRRYAERLLRNPRQSLLFPR